MARQQGDTPGAPAGGGPPAGARSGKRPRAARPAGHKAIRITQVKSPIGYSWRQKRIVAGLGLGRPGYSVVLEDTPSVRGMCTKIAHMVRVEEVVS